MVTRLHFTLFCVALLQIYTTATSGMEVSLAAEPRQSVKGWGATLAPLDWDGRTSLRDGSVADRVLRRSGLSIGRVLIGPGGLYGDTSDVNQDRILDILQPQIDAFTRNGIGLYILCVTLPPTQMRKYRSDEAYVETDMNTLRPEAEPAFLRFLVALPQVLRSKGLPLPTAITFQAQPDIPPAPAFGTTGMPGCIYSPEQWVRIATRLRRALDDAGFSGIGLIGPETLDPHRTADFLKVAGRDGIAILSGISLAGGASNPSEALGQCELETAIAKKEVWIVSHRPNPACRSDRELIVDTFRSLCRDFVEVPSTYWFWPYVFTLETSPFSLASGSESYIAPIEAALTDLWRSVPVGAHVHILRDAVGISLTTMVGFFTSNQRTIVMVNTTTEPLTVQFHGLNQPASFRCYSGAGMIKRADVKAADPAEITVPPEAVALLTWRL